MRMMLRSFALWNLVGFAVILASRPSEGAQVLLLDATYSHQADNSAQNNPIKMTGQKGSHAYFWLNSAGYTNWVAPVNFRDGKMHVVVDVLSKPTTQMIGLAFCVESPGAACVGYASIQKPARYSISGKPGSAFLGYGPDFTKGFRWGAVVLRDQPNGLAKKLDLGQGFAGEPNYNLYFPMKMRVRAYLVSVGSTFQDPEEMPPQEMDAGTQLPEEPAPDGGTADAGTATEPPEPESTPEQVGPSGTEAPASETASWEAGSGEPHFTGEVGCQAAPAALLPLGLLMLFAVRRRSRSAEHGDDKRR